jgi:hypothetical protein
MTQFTGLVIRDERGEPEEFSKQAAEQLVRTVTEPIQIIPTDSGKYIVKIK